MTDPWLFRRKRPPHYPKECSPESNPETTLAWQQVPLRPARFAVGLEKDLFPPPGKVNGTPLSIASYLGRVDEVGEDGEVTVTVWERPNGREGLTTLSASAPYFDHEPDVGDLLWIWTWIDVSENHVPEGRIYVEVESRELDEEDRARLGRLLGEIQKDKE